jgi:DNA-binding MarR family transcriptional regulator
MATLKMRTAVPVVGEGKRGEQGHMGYLLRQADAAHKLRIDRALSDIAVTFPQFMVLVMLTAYPGASGADLARLALLTPQTMSVIVTNLERMGAISRRPHAVHGRIQHVEITKTGKALLAKCRARVKSVEDALLAGLPSDDEEAIRRWLVNVAVQSTLA